MSESLGEFTLILERINALEPEFSPLSDDALFAKTEEFRGRHSKGATLSDLVPESFAAVREAAKRVTGLRLRDTQILGGIALHDGRVAQMETGEGKTLTAVAPAYLNALTGGGVHILTPTDYLSWRDGRLTSPIFFSLGLVAGSFQKGLSEGECRAALNWDVTYASFHDAGLEYLRGLLKHNRADRWLRERNYAIVDELDAVLIDEAKTPLIITSETGITEKVLTRIDRIGRELNVEVIDGSTKSGRASPDAVVNIKRRTVVLTASGLAKCSRVLRTDPSTPATQVLVRRILLALEARYLYCRGTDYSVVDKELVALENGREARHVYHYGGLHDALEAKEDLPPREENQTLATVSVQNYFKGYKKLSGMTATATGEIEELRSIYRLEVVEIPPHRPCARIDFPDHVYRSLKEKHEGILEDVRACWKRRRPVLLATRFWEEGEKIADLLKKDGIPFSVLKGRGYEIRDSDIIEKAGHSGSVTIIPEVAGLGVHIHLGGFPVEAGDADLVRSLGGLHLIGCERGLSRRMDDQVRGRVARQGEPGSSRFHVSLEDDLCRLGGDLSQKLAAELGRLEPNGRGFVASESTTRLLSEAQLRIKRGQYDLRAALIDTDSCIQEHLGLTHELRDSIFDGGFRSNLLEMAGEDIKHRFESWLPLKDETSLWDAASLTASIASTYAVVLKVPTDGLSRLDRMALEKDAISRAVEVVLDQWSRLEETDSLPAVRATLEEIVNDASKTYMHDIDRLKKNIFLSRELTEPMKFFEARVRSVNADSLRRLRESVLEEFVHFPPRTTA